MNIAIIPARGGSKRIPRKNIRTFAGKPIIAHSIEVALRSGLFDQVVVSTDDKEIAAISEKSGAEVPFFRDTKLADDFTATLPVVKDAVLRLAGSGRRFEFVCCIYPCAPFISVEDLSDSLSLLKGADAEFSFPVASFQTAIQRALRLGRDGSVSTFYPGYEAARSQDLEPAYHDAGQFYWGTAKAWIENDMIYNSSVGLVIPHWRVVDIDTVDDWRRAELIYSTLMQPGSDHE